MPDPKQTVTPKYLNNATKVEKKPEGYKLAGVEGNKTFYDTEAPAAITGKAKTTPGDDKWKQAMIKMLQGGVSPQELVSKGHIDVSRVKEFEPYYKPVYTEQAPVSKVETNNPVQGTRNAFREIWPSGLHSNLRAWVKPDINGQVNMSEINYTDKSGQNQVDPNKWGTFGYDTTKLNQAYTGKTLDDLRGEAVRSDAQGMTQLPTKTATGTPIINDYSKVKTNDPNKSGTVAGANLAGGFRNGGLVKHIKGYAEGGDVEQANLIAGLGTEAADLGGNLAKDEYGRYNTGSKFGNYYVASGLEGGKGALKGAAMGAALGPEGMAVGAAAGGILGSAKGLYIANQGNKSIDDEKRAKILAEMDARTRKQNYDFQNNLAAQRQTQVNSYKHGGIVKGPGTSKSDSIEAKVKEGSFVVPAEKVAMAKKLTPPSVKKKEANINQKGGTEVKLSNGEMLLDPKTKNNLVKKYGEEVLEVLAPDAEENSEMEKAHMAKGGDIDPKVEKAKLEAAKKAREAEKAAIEAKTAKDKQYYAVKNAAKKALEKQLQDKQNAEAEVKKHQAEYKALQKAYELHDKQTSESLNLKQDATEKGVGTSGRANAEDVAKQKEELLSKIEAKKAMLDKAIKDLEYASNEKNYISPKQIASQNTKESDFKKALVAPKVYSTTGDNINKNMPEQNKSNSIGSGVASNKGTASRGKVTFSPNLSTDNPDIVPPVINKENNAPTPEQNSLVQTARKSEKEYTPADSKKKIDYLSLAGQGADQLRGLGNYILPFKQTQMGLKYLSGAGERPVDQIDPMFQASVDKANANAKYGFTPEEQAAIDMQNQDLLNSQKAAARNYSGGSSSNAYNMERDAANQSFARGLQAKIQSRDLQLQKQGYADNLNASKAEMSRRLFGDRMNAWQQNQQAGSALVGAGLKNMIGASRYNAELNAMKQAGNVENGWINNI